MNNLTPYEHSLNKQLTDLPVPAEEHAWEQMEILLNKDDDDGIIPPPVKTGCRPLTLLLLLLITSLVISGLYFADPWNWFSGKQPVPVSKENNKQIENQNGIIKQQPTSEAIATNNTAGNPEVTTLTGSVNTNTKTDIAVAVDPVPTNTTSVKTENSISNRNITTTGTTSYASTKRNDQTGKGIKPEKEKPVKNIRNVKKEENATANINRNKKTKRTGSESKIEILNGEAENTEHSGKEDDSGSVLDVVNNLPVNELKQDTSVTTVAINKTQIADTVTLKQDSSTVKHQIKDKKKIYYSAGLSIYQGIPLSGSVDYAVNQSGKTNAISDYIPSLYFRINKEDKWFIHTELRYGVPQFSNGFVYKKTIDTDASQNKTTTIYKLQKTYYFQVPVSFNYYILPGWSVGTGIVFNKFTGALSTETKEYSSSRLVNDSLISFRVVKDKDDSTFIKNSFQWQLETQYKWKKWSFGARYGRGLQPYIKYTDPVTEEVIKARYQSLNIFVRYELWKSRK